MFRELQRIADEVQEQLAKTGGIGHDRLGNTPKPFGVERNALLEGADAHERNRFNDDLVRRTADAFILHLTGLDLREVEDVVDDREEVRAAAADGGEMRAAFRSGQFGVAIEQQIGEPQNRVERRANFVAHIRQELTLGLVGGFRNLFGFFETFFGLSTIGDVLREPAVPGASAAAGRGDRELHWKRRAVPADAADLNSLVENGRQISEQIRTGSVAIPKRMIAVDNHFREVSTES
ncbi:MAG TPA: hypothetical protein VL132_16865, partial [Planctomycetaceae bacterium]|nr:hypothetical protein [Planctomycetaceae bacterium]